MEHEHLNERDIFFVAEYRRREPICIETINDDGTTEDSEMSKGELAVLDSHALECEYCDKRVEEKIAEIEQILQKFHTGEYHRTGQYFHLSPDDVKKIKSGEFNWENLKMEREKENFDKDSES